MEKQPNPGSKDARKYGCVCPVVDNHYGKGVPNGTNEPDFWISGDCPMHGTVWKKKKLPRDPLDRKLVKFLDYFEKESWENIGSGRVVSSELYLDDLKKIFTEAGWKKEVENA